MNIIIIGCGKVGRTLAVQLNNEGHNITLIDKNEKRLQQMAMSLDVIGITGNGAMLEVQKEADIDHADLLIAATGSDEINMLCCLIAKKEGHCLTICRIRDIEYETEIDYLRHALGIDMVINPEKQCAHRISRLLDFPAALEIETFYRGRIDMIKLELTEKSVICNAALKDLSKITRTPVLICIIERDGKTIIPSGDTILRKGDRISFIAEPANAIAFCREVRPEVRDNYSVFFIGGGRVAKYCGFYLNRRRSKHAMKFIDSNLEVCRDLEDRFPNATVINADGLSMSTLYEEGIESADALVTITNNDEGNIILSMVAGQLPGIRLITKVNHMDPESIPSGFRIGSLVSPKQVTSDETVRFVRSHLGSMNSNIESLYKVAGGKVEAQEYEIAADSAVTEVPLKDLHFKSQILIAAIIRDRKLISPGGQDVLKKGDHVVIVTASENKIRDLKDILA